MYAKSTVHLYTVHGTSERKIRNQQFCRQYSKYSNKVRNVSITLSHPETHFSINIFCKLFVFSNSLMNFMIEGSRFKAALEAGKSGECGIAYRKCPFDQNSIYMFLRQISNKS